MKRSMRFFAAVLAVLSAGIFSHALRAQNPAAETLQQKVALREQTDALPASDISSPDLGDISVVQTFPKPATLTFSTAQEFFYTDNVFYTDKNEVASTAYLGSYTASWVPYSLRDWTPRVAAQYNMARFDSAAAGDFDNENLAVSSQYIFSQDRTWSWTADVNLSRFTTPHDNDREFYKEVVYDNQITNTQQFFKDVPFFFVSAYDLAYHQAHPSNYDRLDNTFSVSLAWYPIPELSIGPFVRPSARIYPTNTMGQTDRDDFNLSEGLDVTWKPCKYFSLSADFLHTNDYSNNASQSYNNTVPGVTASGTIEF